MSNKFNMNIEPLKDMSKDAKSNIAGISNNTTLANLLANTYGITKIGEYDKSIESPKWSFFSMQADGHSMMPGRSNIYDSFMVEQRRLAVKKGEAEEPIDVVDLIGIIQANYSKTPSVKRSFSLKKWFYKRVDSLKFCIENRFFKLELFDGILIFHRKFPLKVSKIRLIRLWYSPHNVPFEVKKIDAHVPYRTGQLTITPIKKFQK